MTQPAQSAGFGADHAAADRPVPGQRISPGMLILLVVVVSLMVVKPQF